MLDTKRILDASAVAAALSKLAYWQGNVALSEELTAASVHILMATKGTVPPRNHKRFAEYLLSADAIVAEIKEWR